MQMCTEGSNAFVCAEFNGRCIIIIIIIIIIYLWDWSGTSPLLLLPFVGLLYQLLGERLRVMDEVHSTGDSDCFKEWRLLGWYAVWLL
jgi:hypothetical protein